MVYKRPEGYLWLPARQAEAPSSGHLRAISWRLSAGLGPLPELSFHAQFAGHQMYHATLN